MSQEEHLRRGGRPKQENPRDKMVGVWVNASEYRKLQQAMVKHGYGSASSYIRLCLFGTKSGNKKLDLIPPAELQGFQINITRIGVLLNQIAKIANTEKTTSPVSARLSDTLEELKDEYARISNLLK